MNAVQTRRAKMALKSRLRLCRNCGTKKWILGDIVDLPLDDDESSGMTIPALVVRCASCDALQMFSAVALGLSEAADEDYE